MQALARHTSIKLKEIYDALEKEEDKYNYENRLRGLFGHKLNEIDDVLMFTDIDRFIDKLYNKLLEDPNIIKKILKKLESIYANEISFLLYLIIGRDLGIISNSIGSRFVDSLARSDIKYDLPPSSTLTAILENDKDVKAKFSRWINDSMVYQKKVFDIMYRYNNKIRRNKRICQQCGKINSIGSNTCKACRSKLKITCEKCGHIPPYTSSFCNKCGFGL